MLRKGRAVLRWSGRSITAACDSTICIEAPASLAALTSTPTATFPVCSPTVCMTRLAGTPEASKLSNLAFFPAKIRGLASLLPRALDWEDRVGVLVVTP
ncbi:unnamed protein product [Linum trigynum]|uniref:Uncharacterized protein n=1 Tax=Linum trigynum TaxID=586398 RepID=A0AAV2DRV5_9ROSI